MRDSSSSPGSFRPKGRFKRIVVHYDDKFGFVWDLVRTESVHELPDQVFITETGKVLVASQIGEGLTCVLDLLITEELPVLIS